MLEKTIKCSSSTHQQLLELKTEMDYSTIDEAIQELIRINKLYRKSKVVRVIE